MPTSNPNYQVPNADALNKPITEINPEGIDASKGDFERVSTENPETKEIPASNADLTDQQKKQALEAIIGNSKAATEIMNASAAGKDPAKVIDSIYSSSDLTPHHVLDKDEDPHDIVAGLYGENKNE